MDAGSHRERLDRARALGKTHRLRFGGVAYERVTDDAPGLGRGAVALWDGAVPRIVPPFPSIARVVALAAGVRSQIRGPYRVEEKIDGYNVRVAQAGGEILAFTRGGFACPFTTDRLPDLADLRPLFREEPDAVIGAEIAGAGSPYLTAQARPYSDDVAFFGFDLMQMGADEPEPVARRDDLFARCGVPRAPELMRGTAADEPAIGRLRELALELDRERAEGMILKPEVGSGRIKYVTPAVNLADITADAPLLAELPEGFFTSRMLRLVVGARELGAAHRIRDFEAEAGRAFAEGLGRALDQLEREGKVYEEVSIRVRDPAAIDALVAHLNRSSRVVQSHEVSRVPDGAHTRAVLRKVMMRSTSYLKSLLRGDPIVD